MKISSRRTSSFCRSMVSLTSSSFPERFMVMNRERMMMSKGRIYAQSTAFFSMCGVLRNTTASPFSNCRSVMTSTSSVLSLCTEQLFFAAHDSQAGFWTMRTKTCGPSIFSTIPLCATSLSILLTALCSLPQK